MKKSLVLFLFVSLISFSQQEQELARVYLEKGDVEKAYEMFKSIGKDVQLENYYEDYRYVLLKLNKEKELLKLYKSLDDDVYLYRVDKALVEYELGDQKAKEKVLQQCIKEARIAQFDTEKLLAVLQLRKLYAEATDLIDGFRSASKDAFAFANELAGIYMIQGKKKDMVDEYINFVLDKPEMMEYVQGKLQQHLPPNERGILEDAVYARLSSDDSYIYNQLLSWHYIQRKEFFKAFMEERAIDQKRFLQGKELLEFGDLVGRNGEYEIAEKVYQYILTKYATAYIAYTARQRMIKARENLVMSQYPVDTNKVKELINDYEELRVQSRRIEDQVDAKRNIAKYLAYYLSRENEAIEILQELVTNSRIGQKRMAECKIELADILTYQENEWEALLLYGQVVKESERIDVDLAHLAKLKTGKVYYYMSDFDLAKEYLEILKLATSREIANDAIDLAVFIQDNLGLDTSNYALKKYANAERLYELKRYEQSLSELQRLETELNKDHGMVDEIYWLRGRIYQQINNTAKARENYEVMIAMSQDIYTDDAVYKLALLEEKEGNVERAKELYKQLMIAHPGSIYVAEARKKFRALRGDHLSN